MKSKDRVACCALWGILSTGAVVLALRSFLGPFSFGVRVDSPLNVEALVALTSLLVLALRSDSSGENAEALPLLTWAEARLPVFFLILLTAVAYGRATHIFFLSDDFNILKTSQAPSAFTFRSLFAAEVDYGFYRPIAKLSFALTSLWAGTNPTAWHLSNLVLHCANSILVFFLASRVCASLSGPLFAAALFSVHGTRPEAVVWIAGRFDLLATFFVLCGLILFLRSFGDAATSRYFCRFLSLVCMILAILCKESAYVFPLLLVLFLALRGNRLRGRIGAAAPFFLVAGALFVLRLVLFGGIGGYRVAGEGNALAWTFRLVPAVKALLPRMWATLFFPINWSVNPGVLLAVLAPVYVLSLGRLITMGRINRKTLALALGFAMISALPPLHMLLIGADLEKSRLLYLPSVGFCLLAAPAVDSIRKRVYWIAPSIVLAFNVVALEHNLTLWESVSMKAKPACEAAAHCVDPSTQAVTVEEIPSILKGVYFFGNGFQQCVDMVSATPARVNLRQSRGSIPANGVLLLKWDHATESFQCTEKR